MTTLVISVALFVSLVYPPILTRPPVHSIANLSPGSLQPTGRTRRFPFGNVRAAAPSATTRLRVRNHPVVYASLPPISRRSRLVSKKSTPAALDNSHHTCLTCRAACAYGYPAGTSRADIHTRTTIFGHTTSNPLCSSCSCCICTLQLVYHMLNNQLVIVAMFGREIST